MLVLSHRDLVVILLDTVAARNGISSSLEVRGTLLRPAFLLLCIFDPFILVSLLPSSSAEPRPRRTRTDASFTTAALVPRRNTRTDGTLLGSLCTSQLLYSFYYSPRGRRRLSPFLHIALLDGQLSDCTNLPSATVRASRETSRLLFKDSPLTSRNPIRAHSIGSTAFDLTRLRRCREMRRRRRRRPRPERRPRPAPRVRQPRRRSSWWSRMCVFIHLRSVAEGLF